MASTRNGSDGLTWVTEVRNGGQVRSPGNLSHKTEVMRSFQEGCFQWFRRNNRLRRPETP